MNHEKNPSRNDDSESIHDENEFLKMKMMLERGAVFSSPSEVDIPLEIENEFLKNIEKFENGHQSAKRTQIIDFIGKPKFKDAESISDSEIQTELDKIMDLLNENGIALDTICEVDKRTLYIFITEELMLHEIDDVKIEGMMCCFIYEEFHPNHEYDIREHCTDFIDSYFNKGNDFYVNILTKKAEKDEKLKIFRNSFRSFDVNFFEISKPTINEEHATVKFNIDFTGFIEGSNEQQRYSGDGSIDLVLQWSYWCIDNVTFPQKL